MAAMGKVPWGRQGRGGLGSVWVFPIVTFISPPIDLAGTMKKVRLHAFYMRLEILGGNGRRPRKIPAVGMALFWVLR